MPGIRTPEEPLYDEDGEVERMVDRSAVDRGELGRPPEIDEELIDYIARLVRAGNYIETACAAAGVNKTTYYEWLKRGNREKKRVAKAHRDGDEEGAQVQEREALFVVFTDAIEKATAEWEAGDVLTIGRAARSSWQAAAWRLERKKPQDWGRRDHVTQEISGPDGKPIPHDVEVSYVDALHGKLDNLRDRLQQGDEVMEGDGDDEE